MKPHDAYHRFVRWSEEDQAYIGYCPDLYFRGVCHGELEAEVYGQLCQIVEEEVAHRLSQDRPLPHPSVGMTRELEGTAA